MDLQPRITGSELELGLMVQTPDNSFYAPSTDDLVLALKEGLPPELARLQSSIGNYFTGNGSRIYIDVGSHLEIATAEDASFWGTVANEIALEQVLIDTMAAYFKNGRVARLNKRVADRVGNTWGYHENYFMPDRDQLPRGAELVPLLAHLATRQIFTGAGYQNVDGDYELSQKMHVVQTGVSHVTAHPKPLFNTRDEAHTGKDMSGKRLHVVSGDPNMSPWATFMKFATTSIVLRLIEAGEIEMPLLNGLDDYASLARRVSTDTTLKKVIRINGLHLTALAVQELLLEKATAFASRNKLPDEEQSALTEWQTVLEDLSANPTSASDRVDWAGKQLTISRYADRRGLRLNDARLRLLDLQWDSLSADGLGVKLRESTWEKWTDTELIASRVLNPPDNTRALPRSMFIKKFGTAINAKVAWNVVSLDSQNIIQMPDPRDNNCEEVESLIKRTRNAA